MKLKNKTPYIHYLISKLSENNFLIKITDKEVRVIKVRKWYQKKAEYRVWEKDKMLNEGIIAYALNMICLFEKIEVMQFNKWTEEYFTYEIELY